MLVVDPAGHKTYTESGGHFRHSAFRRAFAALPTEPANDWSEQ